MSTKIDHPAPYEAAPEWLETFRQVEPTAEILYVGTMEAGDGELVPGVWCLGSVAATPSPVARSFDQDSPIAAAVRQGFRPIDWYEWQDLIHGSAFKDFRIADWMFRSTGRRLMRELIVARAAGDQRRIDNAQHRLDVVQAEYRSIHAHCFRGRRGLVVDGLGVRENGR